MAFDVNTITLQGAIAVASATVSNKLVIDGCDATTDILTQAQAAQIATRPASPGSTATEIALAGSTDNHVFAYAEFLLGESTGGDFNSFFLYGHLEDDSSTVFVISVCSSTNPVHLPASGDVTNRTEVQFDLTFTPNAEVVKVADTSMYCTRGEFLILKERTVTTHKEQQPIVGENQTIYGDKTFKGALVGNTILPETPAGNLGASDHRFNSVYSTSSDFTSLTCPTINFDSTGLRKIYADGPLKLGMGPQGTGEERYQTRSEFGTNLFEIAAERCDSYGEELDWSIFAMAQDKNSSNEYNGYVRMNVSNRTEFKLEYNSTTDVSACTLESDSVTADVSSAVTVKSGSDISLYVNYDSQYIGGDTQIRLVSTGIGIATKTSSGYSIGLTTNQLNVNAASITTETNETPNIGSASKKFGDAYFKSVHGQNIYGDGDIGSSSSKFTNVYANNLYGKIPTPSISGSSSSEPDIGGIILIFYEVSNSSMSGNKLLAGKTIHQNGTVTDDNSQSGTVTQLGIAVTNGGVMELGPQALSGYYKLLCDSKISTVGTYYRGTALAMRVGMN